MPDNFFMIVRPSIDASRGRGEVHTNSLSNLTIPICGLCLFMLFF